eukprot:PhF_6_TR1049/c0_g1_i1/m.2163
MSTLKEWAVELSSAPGGDIADARLESLTAATDPTKFKVFFNKGEFDKADLQKLTNFFITALNTPSPDLRKKTRMLLVLNNMAQYKPTRSALFSAIKHVNAVFEEAMKKEGQMPFDSELGRMSEHVLVLLMRLSGYKLKAAQVLEFADGNTQFAVQLLLAVLLKEPAYELDLRCNCISGLLGFTQPQAFFQSNEGAAIQEHSCAVFGEKVDFIANLMLRLSALQVIHDVLSPVLFDDNPTVPLVVHNAAMNSMRCVMNIFSFTTQAATQWRQHVLLNTSYIDGVAIPYLHKQIRVAASALEKSGQAVPTEVHSGITRAVQFMSFSTFHLGRHAKSLRIMCFFIHDLLVLPGNEFAMHHPELYVALMHFMANIDALAGEDQLIDIEELPQELTSGALSSTLKSFLSILPRGIVDSWHEKFYNLDVDALVAQDSKTFADIDNIFIELKKATSTAPAGSGPKKTLLGDLPAMKKQDRSGPVEELNTTKLVKPPTKTVASPTAPNVPQNLRCALNGHIMKTPVVTPYGNVFENDTIQQWIAQNGCICPLSGKPLRPEDLKPATEIQKEIVQFHIKESLKLNNPEDEADLYEFN